MLLQKLNHLHLSVRKLMHKVINTFVFIMDWLSEGTIFLWKNWKAKPLQRSFIAAQQIPNRSICLPTWSGFMVQWIFEPVGLTHCTEAHVQWYENNRNCCLFVLLMSLVIVMGEIMAKMHWILHQYMIERSCTPKRKRAQMQQRKTVLQKLN